MNAVLTTLWGYFTWLRLELAGLRPFARRCGASVEKGPTQKRTLLIAPFPPEIHGGVYRPLSFAKYATDQNVSLAVLTNARRDDASEAGLSLLSEVADRVKVEYLRTDKQPSWRFFPALDGGFIHAIHLASHAWKTRKTDCPDILVCSGPPFCFFIAGFWLKRIWGCKLVLDYRDEWGQNPFDFVKTNGFDRWWERRCLHAADQVIFTTDSQKQLHERLFPVALQHKTVVITNGWDESHQPVAQVESKIESDGTLEIAFAGLLSLHTLPGDFVSTLAALRATDLPKLRLTFIGKRNPQAVRQLAESGVEAEIVYEDQIPAAQVIDRLNKAGLLLLMASEDLSRYIPGKFYYYLASKKPILVYGAMGEVQQIVESLGAGRFVASGDGAALAGFLQDVAGEADDWETAARRDWVASHTRKHAADRLFQLLERL